MILDAYLTMVEVHGGAYNLFSLYLLLRYHCHSSFVQGHAIVTKCCMIIRQRLYYPNLAHHVRIYITRLISV